MPERSNARCPHCIIVMNVRIRYRGYTRQVVEVKSGGERGIRTPGANVGTVDFESTPFGLSGISPQQACPAMPVSVAAF